MNDRWAQMRNRLSVRPGNEWYRVSNLNSEAPEILIYDEIGYLGITAKDFAQEINGIDAEKLTVRISSPGGQVWDGLAIYNTLRNHKANVTVVVDGLAASAASFIAQAGDQRIMARNAQMMIHDGQGLAVGDAATMRELADLLDKTSDNLADIYAQRAGGTADEWRKAMRNETWYSAEEAVEAGLADEVQGESQTSNKWDVSIFNSQDQDREQTSGPAPVDPLGFDPVDIRRAFEEAIR